MKTVMITGVSTGIGHDVAATMLRAGWQVIGSVRRADQTGELAKTFGERFFPVVFDVTDSAAIDGAVAAVEKVVGATGIQGLVNNAGIAVAGPLLEIPVEEFQQVLDVNVLGPLRVTQAFAPLLLAGRDNGPCRIVNISSVSGRIAYPFLGPYAASKHALEAFSDSLRRELMLLGIDVVVIEPGNIRTPIWDKAQQMDLSRYRNSPYREVAETMRQRTIHMADRALAVERVSDCVRRALCAHRVRSRYAIPSERISGWLLPRWLPDRWFDRLTAIALGLRPRKP